MGADMVLCCAPACKLTPERLKQIEQVVLAIPGDDPDLIELMERLGYEDAVKAREGILCECRISQEEHREIATLHLPGCSYQVRAAGGLTWGDPPSDGYVTLEHVSLCPQLWELVQDFA